MRGALALGLIYFAMAVAFGVFSLGIWHRKPGWFHVAIGLTMPLVTVAGVILGLILTPAQSAALVALGGAVWIYLGRRHIARAYRAAREGSW